MSNTETVALIYALAGSIFIGGLVFAVVLTGARVVYYARNDQPRPRLLTRDIIVKGGMALSFLPIALVRFLPPEARSQLTTGNVAWALVTAVPAALAILVYLYFEIWVIERAGRER